MQNLENDERYRVNEARRHWGLVFNEFMQACECVKSAWHHVKNKQAWIEEDKRRLESLIAKSQKVIEEWETRKTP